jgi:hypothetical protein
MKKGELKAETVIDDQAQQVTRLRNKEGTVVAHVILDKAGRY